MDRTILFENIRQTIIYELVNAKKEILIAVAWITDTDILNLLTEKIKNGIELNIVVMDDKFNQDYFLDKNPLRNHIIFNKNCHHKYCIIDDKIAISGSYNWTFSAKNRKNGENICLFNDKAVIYEFKNNFESLVGKIIDEVSITDYYIEKLNEIGYNESVDKDNIDWWFSLSEQWKLTFFDNLRRELDDISLNDFERDNYDNLMYDYYSQIYIEEIERLCINSLLILILNLTRISSIILGEEMLNLQPLLKLRFLKYVDELEIYGDANLTASDYIIIGKLSIKNFRSCITLPSENGYVKLQGCEAVKLKFSEVSKDILSFLPFSITELSLSGSFPNKRNNLELEWFNKFQNLQHLKLEFFHVYIDSKPLQIPKIDLNWCELSGDKKLPDNFNLDNSYFLEF